MASIAHHKGSFLHWLLAFLTGIVGSTIVSQTFLGYNVVLSGSIFTVWLSTPASFLMFLMIMVITWYLLIRY